MIDEEQRLDELRRYDLIDGDREEALDRVAEAVAIACGAPIGCIALVEDVRIWVKAAHGIAVSEMARDASFATETILRRALHVVEDASADARAADGAGVLRTHGIRAYAGAPLITPRGQPLGVICVLDRQPRSFSATACRMLELLRDQTMLLLENRRELLEQRRSEGLRQEAVEALMATKADLEERIALRTREAENARRRVERILARVVDGFVALDRNWRYAYVNDRAAAMFGRTPADLVGKHIWTEFPEGVGQPFHLAYERAMREQVPLTIADHYEPWDRWFENRIYPSPDGITIFFTEITEQRRARDALDETVRRLNEAQAVAHVGSWEWSVAANRVVWSDEMFRIYGLDKERFGGTYEEFLSHVHADDVALTKSVIEAAYQEPGPFVYDHRIVRPDGSVRMLHTRGDVMTDAAGRVLRMVGSCWDTTAQWRGALEVERALAVNEVLLARAADGVLVVDDDGLVRKTNERLASLFDLPDELARPGASAAAVLSHVAGRLADAASFRARFAGEGPAGEAGAATFRRIDGSEISVHCSVVARGRRLGRVYLFSPR